MALIDLKTNLADVKYDRKDLSIEREKSADANYTKFQTEDFASKKRIGERYRGTNKDGGLLRGGAALQIERTAEDARRTGEFLTESKGQLFVAKQFFLQAFNADSNTRIYNPLSLVTSLPNNVSQNRHIDTGDGSIGGFLGGVIGLPRKKKNGKGAVTLFSKDRKRKLQVNYGGEIGNLIHYKGEGKEAIGLPKDFIKFRIRDAVNGRWIIFPALVSGITDNSSQTPTEIQYIGRPDKVYIYGTTERSISFTLNVVALNKGEIETIWDKVNYLKGLVHPEYKQFFTDNDNTNLLRENDLQTRPVAPIIYLTLGDLLHNTPGFFKSVNITIPDNTAWELEDGRQFPHLCQIALDFQYIGKETPTMTGKQFEGVVGQKIDGARAAAAEAAASASAAQPKGPDGEEVKTNSKGQNYYVENDSGNAVIVV